MAKSTEPKNKDLEADILNEGKQAGTTTAVAETKEQAKADETAQAPGAENESLANKRLYELASTDEVKQSFGYLGPKQQAMIIEALAEHLETTKDKPEETPVSLVKFNSTVEITDDFETLEKSQQDLVLDALEPFFKERLKQNEKAKHQPEKEMTNEEHEANVKKYGKGYVKARRGKLEQVFTLITWQRMGGNKNQDGWQEIVQTPPEVKNLQTGK